MATAQQLKAAGIPVADMKKVIDAGTRLTVTQGGEIVGLVEHLTFHVATNTIEVVLSER